MINIEMRGLDQLLPKINSLGKELVDQVVEKVSDYSLEVMRTEQPDYKYVSRADAYPDAPAGPGFFSDRQRRWFFAALASGELSIPYNRTGTLASGWTISRSGNSFVLSNNVPYAPYVQGFAGQSRHERMVGWRNVKDLTEAYLTFRNSKYRDVTREAIRQALHNVRIE